MEKKGEILIYQGGDGKTQLEVRLENETVWLSQKMMSELFDKNSDTIGLHIKNIFKEKELDERATTELLSVVQTEGKREVNRQVNFYNLDVIISVGYRVNSKRGTQFRIWATQTLKEHLTKGYTINQKRLEQQQEKLLDLQHTLDLIKQSVSSKEINSDEAKGLLDIISNYTRSFVLLNKFDSDTLELDTLTKKGPFEINYDEAVDAILQLKKQLIVQKEASDLFGRQRDDTFKGILLSIIQTFAGSHLYPSIEEQASHLLYFIIKNHPFADGNKRIGAFLFIWFLQRNRHLLRKSGEAKINDNALVALALLIAQSDPVNKELMIKLVINLINE
jgi:death-on-curing family protein